jgi:hypothetical protein
MSPCQDGGARAQVVAPLVQIQEREGAVQQVIARARTAVSEQASVQGTCAAESGRDPGRSQAEDLRSWYSGTAVPDGEWQHRKARTRTSLRPTHEVTAGRVSATAASLVAWCAGVRRLRGLGRRLRVLRRLSVHQRGEQMSEMR